MTFIVLIVPPQDRIFPVLFPGYSEIGIGFLRFPGTGLP